jgi:hypothetical protein
MIRPSYALYLCNNLTDRTRLTGTICLSSEVFLNSEVLFHPCPLAATEYPF